MPSPIADTDDLGPQTSSFGPDPKQPKVPCGARLMVTMADCIDAWTDAAARSKAGPCLGCMMGRTRRLAFSGAVATAMDGGQRRAAYGTVQAEILAILRELAATGNTATCADIYLRAYVQTGRSADDCDVRGYRVRRLAEGHLLTSAVADMEPPATEKARKVPARPALPPDTERIYAAIRAGTYSVEAARMGDGTRNRTRERAMQALTRRGLIRFSRTKGKWEVVA